MKISIQNKLESLVDNHKEISSLLADPETISNKNKFRTLSQRYAQLAPIIDSYIAYKDNLVIIKDAEIMMEDNDKNMRDMAKEELANAQSQEHKLVFSLQKLLLPKDLNDRRNIFLEVRAGTGGYEAALFAGDLYRMFIRYAESRYWRVEIVNIQEGEHGGYKEVVIKIIGDGAYSRLKFESGGHRVQRVPETESQGRIHTSTCTVAVIPEVDELNQIKINAIDLRIDTFRASGAGGQHVNKTDSAIRITHLPTNTVVECQSQRSQHKNRAQAMSVLQSRIISEQKNKIDAKQAEARRLLIGSGDRSERIRTYNYQQGRITDHRINLTIYKLAEVMQGSLDQIIEPIVNEYQADQLAFTSKN
ncbi:MAG: peptide chain release factor 1 [Piscirickettsiaceae bacterium]|nr:peptide chain release factor 1 [Piscirickettsiaceae bacterium]